MNKKYFILFVLLILVYGFVERGSLQEGDTKMAIVVISSAFKEAGMIPPKYTCDGDNISPPLQWQQVPQGTARLSSPKSKSLALICDDPDAPIGIWVHWVMWNIPAEANGLPQSVPAGKDLPDGSKQGVNSSRKQGYSGPCPPSGTHRYYFKVYAIDTMLDLPADSTKQVLLDAMKGHILAEGQLMGKYRRQ
jgi:Raf kinase inhibitor-like YbhB/YbcL family protein